MEMVDLSLTKAEKREQEREAKAPVVIDRKYPYGLTLRLEDGTLDKLGLKELPEVGDELHLEAVACVTKVECRETDDGEDRCVELQIEMMACYDEGPEDDDSAADENREERSLRGKPTPVRKAVVRGY